MVFRECALHPERELVLHVHDIFLVFGEWLNKIILDQKGIDGSYLDVGMVFRIKLAGTAFFEISRPNAYGFMQQLFLILDFFNAGHVSESNKKKPETLCMKRYRFWYE